MSQRPYIRVPLQMGETTRVQLLRLGLLDIQVRIESSDGFLYVPLIRLIDTGELVSLELQGMETGIRQFKTLVDTSKRLIDLLESELSPEELRLLPRAFDMVGDIAILEIPHELRAHEQVIGRAFHRIHPMFATVLVKRGAISGTTRTRQYECIAGIDKTETVHTEYGCRIAVDLAKAYFSPRLSEEHRRVASLVKENETVIDMFTGVGPFALHISHMHRTKIYAIDVNPHAIELLRKSMSLNRLIGTIIPIVADAHDYVRTNFHMDADRVIMNHPSAAASFIKDACHAVRPGGTIHYYDFIAGDAPESAVREKIEDLVSAAGRSILTVSAVRRVRESAPHEFQMVVDVVIQ